MSDLKSFDNFTARDIKAAISYCRDNWGTPEGWVGPEVHKSKRKKKIFRGLVLNCLNAWVELGLIMPRGPKKSPPKRAFRATC